MHSLSHSQQYLLFACIRPQEDVKGAVEYAQGQIKRLLSGQVELWELPLTGGLWRVTGQEIANVISPFFCRLAQPAPFTLWPDIKQQAASMLCYSNSAVAVGACAHQVLFHFHPAQRL